MPDPIDAGRPLPLPGPLIVERLAGDADLDAVVALEAASFTNPWTREMLVRELDAADLRAGLRAAPARHAGSRRSARAG